MPQLANKPTLEVLQGELADTDYKLRKLAVRRIAYYYPTQAVDPLLLLLKDVRGDVRSRAIQVLTRLGDQRATRPFLEMLSDKSARVRLQAAQGVSILAPQQAVTPLLGLLNDPSSMVSGGAAERLGLLGDLRAVPALIAFLPTSPLRSLPSAIGALGRLGDQRAVEPLFAVLNRIDALPVTNALRRIGGEQVLRGLQELLADETRSTSIRMRVADALALMGCLDAVPCLIDLLGSMDFYVRIGAVSALARLGDQRAIAPLLGLLEDESQEVHRRAIIALGTLNAGDACERVRLCLSSPFPGEVRVAAAFLARQQDQGAVQPLLKILASTEHQAWGAVVQALSAMRELAAVEPLLQIILENNVSKPQICAAIRALGMIGDRRAVEPLLGLLDPQDKTYYGLFKQRLLVNVFVLLGDPRAIEPLHAMYDQFYAQLRPVVKRALKDLRGSVGGQISI